MKINYLILARLRNEEHFQFHTEFSDLVVKTTPEVLGIGTLYPAYSSLLTNEAEALNQIRKNHLTAALSAADDRRDSAADGLFHMVDLSCAHFSDSVKEAAFKVQLVLDQYDHVGIKPYNEETAAINKLISELQTNYAAEVEVLGISSWISELQAANNQFEELMTQRYSEKAEKSPLRMNVVRKEIDASYNGLVELINALIIVNGDEAYAGFVGELNERILKYSLILAQRKGRNSKKDEEDDDTTEK